MIPVGRVETTKESWESRRSIGKRLGDVVSNQSSQRKSNAPIPRLKTQKSIPCAKQKFNPVPSKKEKEEKNKKRRPGIKMIIHYQGKDSEKRKL